MNIQAPLETPVHYYTEYARDLSTAIASPRLRKALNLLTETWPSDYNLSKLEQPMSSEPPRQNGAREWRNWQTRET